MSDLIKAASILRQYAGELYQGHTIGGEWDGEHIKAEHDELLALADRLALAQGGEAVAYTDGHGMLWLPGERVTMSGTPIPLFAHPVPTPAPAAVAAPVAWRWLLSDGTPDSDRCFKMPGPDDDIVAVASSRDFPRVVQYLYTHPAPGRVAELEAQLAESRECIARAYGLLWHVNAGIDAPWGTPSLTPERAAMESRKVLRDMLTSKQRGDGINAARDIMKALAADQGKK